MKLREIFASVQRLPGKRARWVEVQVVSLQEKNWHKGWILRELANELELLTEDGHRTTFHKKKLTGQKPAADFGPTDVWAIRGGDFAKYCRAFLAEKKKNVRDDSGELGAYQSQRRTGRGRRRRLLTPPVWPAGRAWQGMRNSRSNS